MVDGVISRSRLTMPSVFSMSMICIKWQEHLWRDNVFHLDQFSNMDGKWGHLLPIKKSSANNSHCHKVQKQPIVQCFTVDCSLVI
ncbi:hypothetical protein KIN20_032149 [Parelaphostrongylus tenuis]|uniref:Uncharacterized protein n=1 Tax=Parelaphostrongylus tenuis TaxID=148309 RepID=A0AAD5WHB8_PARTN|nr:hypothetical protein KIN20_032149 [Parelaphostrongylus tenuis]